MLQWVLWGPRATLHGHFTQTTSPRCAVLNVPAARRRGTQPQQVAQLAFSMTA